MNDIDRDDLKELVKEAIEEIFCSDDEYSYFSELSNKINKLLEVGKYEARLDVSIATCDKFEDYMKNVDRLNEMINEFKGLVSIVRGEAKAVQKQNESIKKKMRKLLEDLSE